MHAPPSQEAHHRLSRLHISALTGLIVVGRSSRPRRSGSPPGPSGTDSPDGPFHLQHDAPRSSPLPPLPTACRVAFAGKTVGTRPYRASPNMQRIAGDGAQPADGFPLVGITTKWRLHVGLGCCSREPVLRSIRSRCERPRSSLAGWGRLRRPRSFSHPTTRQGCHMTGASADPQPVSVVVSVPAFQNWCSRCGRREPVTDAERMSYGTSAPRPRCCRRKMCCLPLSPVPVGRVVR